MAMIAFFNSVKQLWPEGLLVAVPVLYLVGMKFLALNAPISSTRVRLLSFVGLLFYCWPGFTWEHAELVHNHCDSRAPGALHFRGLGFSAKPHRKLDQIARLLDGLRG